MSTDQKKTCNCTSRTILILVVKNIHMIILISCVSYLLWTFSFYGRVGSSIHGNDRQDFNQSGKHLSDESEEEIFTSKLNSDKMVQRQRMITKQMTVISSIHNALEQKHYKAMKSSLRTELPAYQIKRQERTTVCQSCDESRRLRRKGRRRNKRKRTKEKDVISDVAPRSLWSEWGFCSVTCGVGQQERTRACGFNCQEIESKPCLSTSCPGATGDKWADKWEYFEMFDKENGLVDMDYRSKDACDMWMKCSNRSIHHYLTKIASLPSCPCAYPLTIGRDKKIWDSAQEKKFTWEDASSSNERLDIYKPGAKYCIRSKLTSLALASQHCCYDNYHRLITRGRDAGTPNLVSPLLSQELHRKVDVLPWVLCKGDWTRYNLVINPDNKRQCDENPPASEIRQQILLAKNY